VRERAVAEVDRETICIRDNTTWIDAYQDNTIIAWQRFGKASIWTPSFLAAIAQLRDHT
jgi:hypothetical protein